jgi:hypothetical protein
MNGKNTKNSSFDYDNQALATRLQVAIDLADALAYVHSKHMI